MITFAEKVSARSALDDFELFQDLVRSNIRKLIHQGIEKNIQLNSLVNWVEVWEEVNEKSSLVDEFNLDKKQLVINTLNSLSDTLKSASIEKL